MTYQIYLNRKHGLDVYRVVLLGRDRVLAESQFFSPHGAMVWLRNATKHFSKGV